MPITFNCTCGKTLRVPDEHAGRRAKCPACNAIVDIPGPDPVFEIVEKPPATSSTPTKSPPVAKPKSKTDEEDQGGTYRLAKS
ncbi:MAG: hypothetical protein L0241_25620 [Planctomycetia bacterium]|nr:hypothetical protein [Planctomycetia bacterium]